MVRLLQDGNGTRGRQRAQLWGFRDGNGQSVRWPARIDKQEVEVEVPMNAELRQVIDRLLLEHEVFDHHLKKFNTEVMDRATMLNGQLVSLGNTWRDQEQKRFVEEFEQHMKGIGRFVEITDQYIPYLLRKAEIIEEYLQQR